MGFWLLLLLPLVSAEIDPWDFGYYFSGNNSFAELPATVLCNSLRIRFDIKPKHAEGLIFVAYSSRRRTMLILEGSKPTFTLSLIDLQRRPDSQRVKASISIPYMTSDWLGTHSIQIYFKTPILLTFQVTKQIKILHLHDPAPPFPMEYIRTTKFFLSKPAVTYIPRDDHWIFPFIEGPSYKGYFRNIIGPRDCDCAQLRRLNIVSSRNIDITNLEACEKHNPCQVGCICESYLRPYCECANNQVKCPDYAPFQHSLPMNNMLGKKITNQAGLTAQASGKVRVDPEHAVRGNAVKLDIPGSEIRISEPPDARTCFSHLAKCEKGVTIMMWLRLENPILHSQNTILRYSSNQRCWYGLWVTHSITGGLVVGYKNQAGLAYGMRSYNLHPERWINVIIQIPDTKEPYLDLFINGQIQTDPKAQRFKTTLPPGQMIHCRSDIVVLGNVTAPKEHGPDGVHAIMIDDLIFRSPMLPNSFLRKLDIMHYAMTTAGDFGEIYQLYSLFPRNVEYKFTTKGVAKAKEATRTNSLILSPVTDGVLTLRRPPGDPNADLCLFNFTSCLNGLYLSVWLKIGKEARAAHDVRLFLWNSLQIRMRNGTPTVTLQIEKDFWSVGNVKTTIPIDRWVFLEASWDRHYGLELFIDRTSLGITDHDYNHAIPNTTESATMILGANVEFQLDDLQLQTAGRKPLTQMEKLNLNDPEKLLLSFNESNDVGLGGGKMVGKSLSLVPSKVAKGLMFKAATSPAYVDIGAKFNHLCLGNINHCPNGVYISFWLLRKGLKGARGSTLLTTGYNGITVTWDDDSHLMVLAQTSLQRWSVRLNRALTSMRYHFVEISWDSRLGLRVFSDLRLVGSDVLPRSRAFTRKDVYRQASDRILVGNWKSPFPKKGIVYIDELHIWAAGREFLSNWKHVPLVFDLKSDRGKSIKGKGVKPLMDKEEIKKTNKNETEKVSKKNELEVIKEKTKELKMNIPAIITEIAYPEFAILPFEWAFQDGRIPNSRLKVTLRGKAKLVPKGKIGSAVSLNDATEDYVSLGDRYDCYGMLDSCASGLTIRFWLFPKLDNFADIQHRQVILAARSYVIYMTMKRKLVIYMRANGKSWQTTKYILKPRWQHIVVSWSRSQGIRLYVDGDKSDIVSRSLEDSIKPIFESAEMFVGRAATFVDGLSYGNFLMDELEFFQAPLDFLQRHEILTDLRLRYYPLNGIQNNRLYSNLSVTVSGDPQKIIGTLGFGLQLPGILNFGPQYLCRDDDLNLCPAGFTLRLWVQVVNDNALLMRAGNAVRVELKRKLLLVFVWSHDKQWTAETTQELSSGRWQLVEVSWQRDEGLLVFVDGTLGCSVYSPLKSMQTRELGPMIIGSKDGAVAVDEIKVWNAKIKKVISSGQIKRSEDNSRSLLYYLSDESSMQSDAGHEGEILYLKFTGNNYLRYNFSGLPSGTSKVEKLTIQFKSNSKNGMLWLGRHETSVNILYLKDGAINLRILHMKHTGEVVNHNYRVKRNTMADGKKHTVVLTKTITKTSITVDNNMFKDEVTLRSREKVFLRPRDLIYFGGLPDTSVFGLEPFNGNIYKAKVEFDWGSNIDFIEDINKIPHKSSNGPKVYVMRITTTVSTPKPTTTKPGTFDMNKVNKALRNIISPVKVPYTFYTSQSRLYLPSWTIPTMKSIEFEFVTYEPHGLLFFIGAGIHGRAYVVLEIFDTIMYSVYSDGDINFRTRLSPHAVNEGHKHRLLLTVEQGYIEIEFDGKEVPIPRIKNPRHFDFDSYTYVGGVDVYSLDQNRLPWDVWSRVGFIGCVNYIQINGNGYYDAREYQDQHTSADRSIGKCVRPKRHFCDHPSDCGHGVCYKRWSGWRREENFFCDCIMTGFTYAEETNPRMMDHEIRGQKCTKPSKPFKSKGKSGRRIVFKPKNFITHTDHISVEFKVNESSMGLFMTKLPSGDSYLKAYIHNGRVYVSTNIFRSNLRMSKVTYEIGKGQYNDGKWHLLTFLRRANYTSFWMDKETPIRKTKLPHARRSYYLQAKFILYGLFNDSTMKPFVGEMRNFYWNAFDFISQPDQTLMYKTEITDPPKPKSPFSLEPPPMQILTPTTFKNGTEYILLSEPFNYLPQFGGTLETIFKTKEKDVMIFHAHQGKHFISFELIGGRPVYTYDIGRGKFAPYLPKDWKDLNNNEWHQIFLAVTSEDDGMRHLLWVDRKKADIGRFPFVPDKLHVYLGGTLAKSRMKRGADHVVLRKKPKFLGCLGKAALNSKSLLNETSVTVNPPHRNTVIFGKCVEPKRCTLGYCMNGGKCVSLDWDKIACNCTADLYEGKYCEKEKPKPKCPKDYCKNGKCEMKYQLQGGTGAGSNKTGWQPVCNCGADYLGDKCETENRCPPRYCSNFGVCSMQVNGTAYCNCTMTAYQGPRCRQKVPGFLTPYKKWGYVIFPARPPYVRNFDGLAFGFQTWMADGNLATFEMANNYSWSIFMRDTYVYLSIDGKREYRIGGPLNDGVYHVLSMYRNGGTMDISLNGKWIRRAIFTDIAKGPEYLLNYTRVIMGANASFGGHFKGAMGGFYWNGYYFFKGMTASHANGAVNIVVTPLSPLPRPSKDCPPKMCKNCGTCYLAPGKIVKCDCSKTAFGGNFCEKRVHYGIWSHPLYPSSAIIDVKPPRFKFKSTMRFAFQTFNATGPLVCLVGSNGKYWKMYLKDGYPILSVNGKDKFTNLGHVSKPLNDGKLHVVTIDRRGSSYSVQLSGCGKSTVHYSDGATPQNRFAVMAVYVGADCLSSAKFVGVIGAVQAGGAGMLNSGGSFYIYVRPFGRKDIVMMPKNLTKPVGGAGGGGAGGGAGGGGKGVGAGGGMGKGGLPKGPYIGNPAVGETKKKPVLIGVAPAGGFGGKGTTAPLLIGAILAFLLFLAALLWACIFCKPGCCCACCPGGIPPAKAMKFSGPFSGFPLAHGVESVPLMKTNGLQSAPPIPVENNVPLKSAPELESAPPIHSAIPPPMPDIGREQMHQFESAPPLNDDDDDIPQVDRATLDKRKDMTLTKSHHMSAVDETDTHNVTNIHHVHHIHHWTADGGGMGFGMNEGGMYHDDDASYRSLNHSNMHMQQAAAVGHNERLDIGFDHMQAGVASSHGDTLDGDHMMEENVFSSELRVNCCQMSRNSKYAVTGSSGAPEVWDLHSGSLIKMMDGSGYGCTGLHLGNMDNILIGQIYDDSQTLIPRLQAWDFASGRYIQMGRDVSCTALTLTQHGHHAVVARLENDHEHSFSILVWDLASNKQVYETHFMPPPGLSMDTGITFLKVSFDDRFVVAGYCNNFDQQANYIVFDLTLSYTAGTVVSPHVVVFDALVDCTEILANNEEAVTGTRLGELVIWDLHSGRSMRHIVIHGQRGDLTTALPAHDAEIHALAISGDGQLLASAGADNLVRSWLLDTEQLQHTMRGHTSDVLSVAISEDNELVVSGSDDGSIRVWRLDRNGSQLCWFTSNISVFHVKLSFNKEVLVALGERSEVRKLIMLRIVRNKARRKHQIANPVV